MAKVSLAGIHYPDTTAYFDDHGTIDVTGELAKRGWSVEERRLYMADQYRAAADMVVRWALSESIHCSVEIDDWFPSRAERQRLLEILDTGRSKLTKVGRWQKVEARLRTQAFSWVVVSLDGAWCVGPHEFQDVSFRRHRWTY